MCIICEKCSIGVPQIVKTYSIKPKAANNRFRVLMHRNCCQVSAKFICENKIHIVTPGATRPQLSFCLSGSLLA